MGILSRRIGQVFESSSDGWGPRDVVRVCQAKSKGSHNPHPAGSGCIYRCSGPLGAPHYRYNPFLHEARGTRLRGYFVVVFIDEAIIFKCLWVVRCWGLHELEPRNRHV